MSWGGRLAELSSTDYTCLRSTLAPTGDIWIGFVQGATSPTGPGNAGMGWAWSGSTTTPTYFNWGASEPDDDNGGNEMHTADCAFVPNGSDTWDDTPCAALHGFACNRGNDT